MSQIVKTKRRGMRTKTFMCMLGALVVVCALLYWELSGVLFAISTLAVCILLLVVAFADLEGRDRELYKQVQSDHAQKNEHDVTKGSPSDVHAKPKPHVIERNKAGA